MPRTFKHSGDMGDVIFSLPAVRAMGGGILYLDPEGGLSSPLVKWKGRDRTKLSAAIIDSATPFLRMQPYVEDVRHWHGEAVDCDLDEFRRHIAFNNLSDSHLAAFKLPLTERDTAWLTIDAPTRIPGRPVVLARNLRYHGNDDLWEGNLPQLKEHAVFVGHPKEHEIFVHTFGHQVPYWPTPDILSLARVLAGCEQFIGTQGLPHAIAEGFKVKLINEYYRLYPSAIFKRPGAQYF
jgi:hypothetical protein